MADINVLAKQFTEFYYNTFDTDRKSLVPLYRDTSMLTWEDKQFQGAASIVSHITSLPFSTISHKVTSLDAQPSGATVGSVLVLVTGQLIPDGGENALQFSQVFHLLPDGGSYFVQNDLFKLNYG